MQTQTKWLVGLAVALTIGAGGWFMAHRQAAPQSPGAHASEGAPSAWQDAGGQGSLFSSDDERPLRTPDQIRHRLFKDGSFAGTEPSGEWCVAMDQKLRACEGLRSRFEYYILGIGEVTIQEIRLLIEDEARRAHGEKLAGEIMAIFDRYWKVRTYEWRHKFIQSDRSTWMPVFEEQKAVRRQIMGADWAQAFFADDESHFLAYYQQLESGKAPPPHPGEPVPQMEPGKDPAAVRAERVTRYGEEAATRLDAVDAQWADWERKLAAARNEWDRVQAMANLSDVQKKDEMDRYVRTNFQDKDQIRVRALLKLP
jgi:lipase chaperone LimK